MHGSLQTYRNVGIQYTQENIYQNNNKPIQPEYSHVRILTHMYIFFAYIPTHAYINT